ncbi:MULTISPECIES: D-alanyl-D-alanine carboxypeptidase family protein [Streptomyces]|uniref:D-alanyl-D-alanine carboxypeptidase n=1 Tax=Streptomyces tsukubensis (strain DSM 42081 / NBRC 108919 / NRRL 18488 / 9993) TaxID=1114943 RepID=I2N2A4_STRT9|nr:serine hydrolase [Streptomyces tsukubensis]MYS62921.1 D-alanyl-D-alanine carboxypeptidase [Streptomyces sp. SID5473]AZK98490.1 D-alanyl-D-alanine carboxypeptidase [Streptomyces tsukubensis]EIF91151.1 D-alanyl-D-alanine carboxypeptidase [Streptomyces tsukubensis NRRL18488]QKM71672.1 D-alanyl-D-alanine carboxypeptidase [Streptomyces tsukubensis NRRL18488]TAI43475.1 D-alanyl-D-alanine carboxypeptidase [Streptomyces tsukubensis]
MRARRAATVVLSSGLLIAASPFAATSAQAAPAVPTVSAKSAFMLDFASGKPVYKKGADTRRQMASTTKIVTAATVLTSPNLNLNRKITIKKTYTDYVVKKGGSSAQLKVGDVLTVRQLLSALMLPSGCDAAYALADAFGTGSNTTARTKSFIGSMNRKAAALGLKNTKYDSFDGISQAGQNYTSANDMALMTRHAFTSPVFREVVKATKYVAVATASNGKKRTYTWYNTNKLLGSYSGAVGVKTGTGTAAGPCLVFAATRNGKTYIGVALNGTDRFTDAAKLLDYGFKSTTAKTMQLRTLPAGAQQD